MKVTANIIKIGGSRGIILPALWFKLVEDEPGTINEVEMEIGDTITISPVKPNKEGGTNGTRETASTDSENPGNIQTTSDTTPKNLGD